MSTIKEKRDKTIKHVYAQLLSHLGNLRHALNSTAADEDQTEAENIRRAMGKLAETLDALKLV